MRPAFAEPLYLLVFQTAPMGRTGAGIKSQTTDLARAAAIGTTASTARISGIVGSLDPKVQKCVRKHAKSHRACQPKRRGAECFWNGSRNTYAHGTRTKDTPPSRIYRITQSGGDFAAPSPDLPKSSDLDAREPTTISDNYTEVNERTDAQEEMPLIWPVLTDAERAGLPIPTRETAPGPVFLVGALAIVLLCAGAIFKLARRQTQSYRHAGRVVSRQPRQPRRPRPSQGIRVHLGETPARLDHFVGRSAVGKRQRPSSINHHDINASLRKIVDDLQRVAA